MRVSCQSCIESIYRRRVVAGILLGLLGTAHLMLGQHSDDRRAGSSEQARTLPAAASLEVPRGLSNLTLVLVDANGASLETSSTARKRPSHQSGSAHQNINSDEQASDVRQSVNHEKETKFPGRVSVSKRTENTSESHNLRSKEAKNDVISSLSQSMEGAVFSRSKIERNDGKGFRFKASQKKEQGPSDKDFSFKPSQMEDEEPSGTHFIIKAPSWSQNLFEKLQTIFNNSIDTKAWAKHKKLYTREMKKETAKILHKVKQVYGLNETSSLDPAQKTQIVIVSGWRSGSSFTYDIIASHPHVFDVFEPLAAYFNLYAKKLRNWSSVSMSEEYIQNLLACNFTRSVRNHLRARDFIFGRSHLYKHCLSSKFGKEVCFDEQFLTSLCRAFPTTLLKFVRLPMNLTSVLLDNPALPKLQVVYLTRDPRAILNSRWDLTKTGWCTTVDCKSSRILCQDMEDDLAMAEQLQRRHPGRVHVLRYEDLVLDPSEKAEELFRDLDLDYHPEVEEFIRTHTSKSSTKVEDTHRRPRDIVMKWVQQMKWSAVQRVQHHCTSIMNRLKYVPISKAVNLTIPNILKSFLFPT